MRHRQHITVNTGELFNRQPPTATDSERSLIGSVILEPGVLDEVALIVTAEMFHGEPHREIWRAANAVYNERRAFDLAMLADALRSRETLSSVGGTSYLMELAESVPAASTAPWYARQVADAATLRRLIESSSVTIHSAYTENDGTTESVRKVLDGAEARLFAITDRPDAGQPDSLAETIEAEVRQAIDGGAPLGLPTGYNRLDDMLGGLRPGELIILAARPSVGKTALAMNIAEQVAFGGRAPDDPAGPDTVPVGVFSMEMGRSAIVQRLLSARSGVDFTKVRGQRLAEHDIGRVRQAAAELTDLPVYIDDTPGLTVMQLRSLARRMVSRWGVRALFVDYLQLMSAPGAGKESRQAEVSEISRGVKALARELNIPVVCLSQLNRESVGRADSRPRLSDLRESGAIEQDADVVLLLHREEYHHRQDPAWMAENPEKVGLAEVIIAKQRNGPCDVVYLDWDGPTMRFANRHAPAVGHGYTAAYSGGGFLPEGNQ
jgi:replicative DNA helicase